MTALRLITIVLNVLIIIGAGHGVGPLGLLEIVSVEQLFSGEIQFNITGSYDDRLTTVALMSVVGQFVLTTAFFSRKFKSVLTITGCVILLLATYILTQNAIDDNLAGFTLMFSIPFIIAAIVLVSIEVKEIWNKEQAKSTASRQKM